MTTLPELFAQYQPKPEFSIYAFQSKLTGRFVAIVFKKYEVRSYRGIKGEQYEGAILSNSKETLKEFFKMVEPYIKVREIIQKSEETPKILQEFISGN
jgi:hypothetical protein